MFKIGLIFLILMNAGVAFMKEADSLCRPLDDLDRYLVYSVLRVEIVAEIPRFSAVSYFLHRMQASAVLR